MPKFSIIVPVYNVEKYIDKCLRSIVDQNFSDYEVIVVNDGTKDNSMGIVKKYPFKIINQKNQGLSVARNTGVKEAKGDYLIFLDSDDYIDKDLLKCLSKSLKNKPDVVRFQIREIYGDKDSVDYKEEAFSSLNGVEAFNRISKFHFVENAWCYAIKREYYLRENFKFMKGVYHEDFGLIPLVIMKASVVNSISYIGYNYLQRNNSIMNSNDYNKTKKKVDDFYLHYKFLISEIDKTQLDSLVFKSFVSNSMILKITELKCKDYKKYRKMLKKEKVYDNILSNTPSRILKKIMLKISPKLFFRLKGLW